MFHLGPTDCDGRGEHVGLVYVYAGTLSGLSSPHGDGCGFGFSHDLSASPSAARAGRTAYLKILAESAPYGEGFLTMQVRLSFGLLVGTRDPAHHWAAVDRPL